MVPSLYGMKASAGAALAVERHALAEDGEFCLRKYRVVFRTTSAPTGCQQGMLVFETNPGRPATASVPWTLRLLPPLAIIPGKLTLTAESHTAADVTVVSRLKPRAVRTQFDASVLAVVPREPPGANRVMKFEVRAKCAPDRPRHTQVLFVAEGIEPGALAVSVLPNPTGD